MDNILSFVWLPVCVILFFVAIILYPYIVLGITIGVILVMFTGLILFVLANIGHIIWNGSNDKKV